MDERAIISEAMRRFAGMRRRGEQVCQVCGRAIPDVTLRRAYCGPTCRTHAYRQRQRAQRATSEAQAATATAPAGPAEPASPLPPEAGARVELRVSLPDVPTQALGQIVRLDGTHAYVKFDRYPQARRVALTHLRSAP